MTLWRRFRKPVASLGDQQWRVFAADHRPGRKRPDYIESVSMDEVHSLRGLAELLRVWTPLAGLAHSSHTSLRQRSRCPWHEAIKRP